MWYAQRVTKIFASLLSAGIALCASGDQPSAVVLCLTYAPYSGEGSSCSSDSDCRSVQPEDGESPCLFAVCEGTGKTKACTTRNPFPSVCGEGRSCDWAGACCLDSKP